MGKQTKSKKPLVVGKGKVTPLQTAFIVDRYLLDNGYTHARSTFRVEAADLIANSPVHEAPKSMLSLAAILDEYITLKEKKVWVDQERCRLEQEKLRVVNLLVGLQGVMNAYNAAENDFVGRSSFAAPSMPQATTGPLASQSEAAFVTPATLNGVTMVSASRDSHIQKLPNNSVTSVIQSTRRKAQKSVLDVPITSKRARKCTQIKDDTMLSNSKESGKHEPHTHPAAQLPSHEAVPNGSNDVKGLFHQEAPLPPMQTPVPKTPPRTSSSETEKSRTPLEILSTPTSAKGVSPHVVSANCTIVSETIRVTPMKQISYYSIEKSHVSSCSPHLKRYSAKDNVRGRLDFGSAADTPMMETQTDGNSTSESDRENSILDLDFSGLDAFGLDFNLSELLLEFDVSNEGQCLNSSQGMDSSPHFSSSFSPHSLQGNHESVASHFPSQLPEEAMAGKDMMTPTLEIAPETITTTRSITKRVRVVSPVKSSRSDLHEEHRQA